MLLRVRILDHRLMVPRSEVDPSISSSSVEFSATARLVPRIVPAACCTCLENMVRLNWKLRTEGHDDMTRLSHKKGIEDRFELMRVLYK